MSLGSWIYSYAMLTFACLLTNNHIYGPWDLLQENNSFVSPIGGVLVYIVTWIGIYIWAKFERFFLLLWWACSLSASAHKWYVPRCECMNKHQDDIMHSKEIELQVSHLVTILANHLAQSIMFHIVWEVGAWRKSVRLRPTLVKYALHCSRGFLLLGYGVLMGCMWRWQWASYSKKKTSTCIEGHRVREGASETHKNLQVCGARAHAVEEYWFCNAKGSKGVTYFTLGQVSESGKAHTELGN